MHYPTDVIGGFALGTAATLLLAPIAMAVLVPLTHSLARTSFAPVVLAPRRGRTGRGSVPAPVGGDHTDRPGHPDTGVAARGDLAA
ncbi:hypothetical protein [Streptacidiphilus sp. PAMC 29251]